MFCPYSIVLAGNLVVGVVVLVGGVHADAIAVEGIGVAEGVAAAQPIKQHHKDMRVLGTRTQRHATREHSLVRQQCCGQQSKRKFNVRGNWRLQRRKKTYESAPQP